MFARTNTGGVPIGSYSKFEVCQQNRKLADRARADKELRRRQLIANHEALHKRTQALRAKWGDKDSEAVARVHERNSHIGSQVQAAKASWRTKRDDANRAYYEEARKRVVEASLLDGKLDAAEARQDELERREARADAEDRRQAFQARKQADILHRRARTAAVRSSVQQGGEHATNQYTSGKKQLAAETARAKQQWRAEREQKLQVVMAKAHTARESAARTRQNAAAARKKQTDARKELARKERENDFLVGRARDRILTKNRTATLKVYTAQRRVLPPDMMQQFESSPWRRLNGSPTRD